MKRSPMPGRDPDKPLRRGKGLSRSGELDRDSRLERQTPIAPVSARRRAENRDRRAMIDRLYPDRPLCVVYLAYQVDPGLVPGEVIEQCGRWADDVHEPLTRGRGGSITDPDNVTAPCRPCHDVLTIWPTSELGWAYELGLLVHSWDAPAVMTS